MNEMGGFLLGFRWIILEWLLDETGIEEWVCVYRVGFSWVAGLDRKKTHVRL